MAVVAAATAAATRAAAVGDVAVVIDVRDERQALLVWAFIELRTF